MRVEGSPGLGGWRAGDPGETCTSEMAVGLLRAWGRVGNGSLSRPLPPAPCGGRWIMWGGGAGGRWMRPSPGQAPGLRGAAQDGPARRHCTQGWTGRRVFKRLAAGDHFLGHPQKLQPWWLERQGSWGGGVKPSGLLALQRWALAREEEPSRLFWPARGGGPAGTPRDPEASIRVCRPHSPGGGQPGCPGARSGGPCTTGGPAARSDFSTGAAPAPPLGRPAPCSRPDVVALGCPQLLRPHAGFSGFLLLSAVPPGTPHAAMAPCCTPVGSVSCLCCLAREVFRLPPVGLPWLRPPGVGCALE